MPLDLIEVANDAEMADAVTVYRTTGAFVSGGWQANPPQVIPMWGVVSIADDEALNMVPEGDRVGGALSFVTDQMIYRTSKDTMGTSDTLLYNGQLYRVLAVAPWRRLAGLTVAVLTRMEGA